MKINRDIFEKEDRPQGIRVNKYLADAGICSRREADAAVEAGKVIIDGVTAAMGSRILPGQEVVYNGKVITEQKKLVLIAFNKPLGIVCTTDRRDPDNIIDFINYDKRIFPIGRLDKESEGLILLTNDGDIVNKILRAGNNHEKEYIVKVNKDLTAEFLTHMSEGVEILDTITKPCRIEQLDRRSFRIILTQGLNRQIRRMCEALGYRVRGLQRVRIMNITLGRLKTGDYRNLYEKELVELNNLIKDSSNAPEAYVKAVNKKSNNMATGNGQGRTRENTDRKRSVAASDNKKRYNPGENGNGSKYRRKESKAERTDRAAQRGSKSIRAGRQGNNK